MDKSFSLNLKKNVPILSCLALDNFKNLHHGFSTRLGGVSVGDFSSMNTSFTRGDSQNSVMENLNIFSNAIDIPLNSIVLPAQTHSANVEIVSKIDCGRGITRPINCIDVDGMITNEKNVALLCYYADCVPIFLFDPVETVIGVVHSGWRGTLGNIIKNTIDLMNTSFNSKPENILASIGPCICKGCFETGAEVYQSFKENIESIVNSFFNKLPSGKFLADLSGICRYELLETGLLSENISLSNECTMCKSETYFSHRYSGEKRGTMCGIISLI